MATKKLSVIIVTYFVRDEVRQCLECLRAVPEDIEVFLVDNGSVDGTREMVAAEFADWPALRPMFLDANVGLAAGNNVPLPLIEGEYVLILNPDTIPTAAALRRMIERLDADRTLGVVGPRQLFEDGTPHSSFHHGWGMAHMVAWTLVPPSTMRIWYDRPARLSEQDAGYVSGACLMIRADLYRRLGGYDETFFLCAEDTADLCRRVWNAGFRVRYITDAELVHYGARSYGHAKPFSLLKTNEGRLRFAHKWLGRVGAAVVHGTIVLNSSLKFAAYGVLGVFARERYWPRAQAHGYVLRNLRARSDPQPRALAARVR